LVVGDSAKLLSETDAVDKLDGRVSFICTDRLEPFVDSTDLTAYPQIKGRVAEFVRFDAKFAPLAWKLLGKTVIVESIEQANALAMQLPGDYNYVTLAGEFSDGLAAIKLGPLGKTSGLISRKSRIHQLQDILRNIETEITETETKIDKNSQMNAHLDKLCKDLRTSVYEATTEQVQINSNLAVIEQHIKRLSEEQPLIAGEINMLEEQIAQSVQKEYDSKQKLQELDTVNSERTARIQEIEGRLVQSKQQQQQLSGELTELRIAVGQIEEQLRSLSQVVSGIQNQMQTNAAAVDGARIESHTCSEQMDAASADILKCESSISEMFVEKENKQRTSTELHEKVEQLLTRQKEAEQIKAYLDEYPKVKAQVKEYAITEWNYAWWHDRAQDNEVGAAWAAASVLRGWMAAGVQKPCFFLGKDFSSPLCGEWGMFSRDGKPKAVANVCRMFNMMAAERVECKGEDEQIASIASTDPTSGKVTVLVISFGERYGPPRKVKISIGNLPVSLKGGLCRQYLVDSTHSNLWNDPARSELEEVRQVPVGSSSSFELDTELVNNAVTLLTLAPPR